MELEEIRALRRALHQCPEPSGEETMGVQANTCLPRDVKDGIAAARAAEDWPPAREILDRIVENGEIGGGFCRSPWGPR